MGGRCRACRGRPGTRTEADRSPGRRRAAEGRATPAGPVRAAAAPRRDRLVRGAPRAARNPGRSRLAKSGRHAGLTAVPHGAKSYLAADARPRRRPGSGWCGSPATPRSAIASPRSWGPGWAIRTRSRSSSRGRALAYERSELVADETAARVAALAAWRSGRARILVASVQALLQHTIAPDDLPDSAARAAARRPDRPRRPPARASRPRLRARPRGRRPRRVRPARRDRRRLPAVGERLPVRIEFFGDEIDSLRALRPDRPANRRPGRRGDAPARHRSSSLPTGGAAALRERLGRERLGSPSGSPRTSPGSRARPPPAPAGVPPPVPPRRPRPAPSPSATPPRSGPPHLAPATGLDHLEPGTLLVLDEPGDLAEAAEFLWRQADERRAELVEAGELPKDWPVDLPRRRATGRRRLVAARTLELTWESECPTEPRSPRGGLSSGDLFGWREPSLPGLALRPAGRRRRALAGRRRPDRPRQRPGAAPRGAARRGRPPGRRRSAGSTRRHRPARSPSSSGASTAASSGGPDGLAFVTDRELFGTVRVRRPKAMRRVVPRDILERLTPGDLVVHIDHGVARYEQMLRRGGGGARSATTWSCRSPAGDRIFVPVEQISRVIRATPAARTPGSAKLGGTEWLRTKQRVRKAVDDLAEELLALYAARAEARGHAFAPDTPWQAEMEASFPYEETVDQLRAVAEVKARHGSRAGRWTGSSWATSATARPRSRCGPRSRRSRTASRSPSSSRRPSSPPSTTRRSASASRRSR